MLNSDNSYELLRSDSAMLDQMKEKLVKQMLVRLQKVINACRCPSLTLVHEGVPRSKESSGLKVPLIDYWEGTIVSNNELHFTPGTDEYFGPLYRKAKDIYLKSLISNLESTEELFRTAVNELSAVAMEMMSSLRNACGIPDGWTGQDQSPRVNYAPMVLYILNKQFKVEYSRYMYLFVNESDPYRINIGGGFSILENDREAGKKLLDAGEILLAKDDHVLPFSERFDVLGINFQKLLTSFEDILTLTPMPFGVVGRKSPKNSNMNKQQPKAASGKRMPTPGETETKILIESKRRCCFCYGLSGDLSEKKGQIAHLDRDNQNSEESNLAFLCLEHHEWYDSKSQQAKNPTENEGHHYKAALLMKLKGDHEQQKGIASPKVVSEETLQIRNGVYVRTSVDAKDERMFCPNCYDGEGKTMGLLTRKLGMGITAGGYSGGNSVWEECPRCKTKYNQRRER